MYKRQVLEVAKSKYDENLKIGTLVSGLMPIAFILQIAWILFFIVWFLLGLPYGPGVNYLLPAGVL